MIPFFWEFYMLRITIALLIVSFALFADEAVVERLDPPELSREACLCTMPISAAKLKISLETSDKKTVVNCYSDSGSQWSLLFGAARKAVQLYSDTNPKKRKEIRIIGSNCMGLAVAIELSKEGYRVSAINEKNLTSERAPGYIALPFSAAEDEEFNEVGLDTFLAYEKIFLGKHRFIKKDAVAIAPLYCHADDITGLEELEARGLIPPPENVTLDFGNGVTHSDFFKYMIYLPNREALMRDLIAEVKRLKIPFEKREVASIDEKVIFNCVSDDEEVPVAAAIISPGYTLCTKMQQNEKEEFIYVLPAFSTPLLKLDDLEVERHSSFFFGHTGEK
jgi:hypothetical protein